MVGGRAFAIHRKTLIIAPPGFETVTHRRINTGAYGNLIPLKNCNQSGTDLSYKHILLLSLYKQLKCHADVSTLFASARMSRRSGIK
jgi:hypothetical protein